MFYERRHTFSDTLEFRELPFGGGMMMFFFLGVSTASWWIFHDYPNIRFPFSALSISVMCRFVAFFFFLDTSVSLSHPLTLRHLFHQLSPVRSPSHRPLTVPPAVKLARNNLLQITKSCCISGLHFYYTSVEQRRNVEAVLRQFQWDLISVIGEKRQILDLRYWNSLERSLDSPGMLPTRTQTQRDLLSATPGHNL